MPNPNSARGQLPPPPLATAAVSPFSSSSSSSSSPLIDTLVLLAPAVAASSISFDPIEDDWRTGVGGGGARSSSIFGVKSPPDFPRRCLSCDRLTVCHAERDETLGLPFQLAEGLSSGEALGRVGWKKRGAQCGGGESNATRDQLDGTGGARGDVCVDVTSSVAGHHPHFWFASDDTMRCIARAVWPEHPWEEAQPEHDGLEGRVNRSADFASGLTLPGDSRSDEEMGSPSRSGTAV